MGLWGTAHASADNKPKNYPTDEDADYKKQDIFANPVSYTHLTLPTKA